MAKKNNITQMFNELEKIAKLSGEPETEHTKQEETKPEEIEQPINIEDHKPELIIGKQLPPAPTQSDQQIIRKSANQSSQEDPVNTIMSMLLEVKEEFETISRDVLGQWQSDRNQIQDVINTFISTIGDNPNNATRPVVEGLVKLLDTKVNSGMTAVKLLEVKTKLLVALRSNGNIIINNQNVASGGQNSELTDLLSSPEENDFS